MRAPLPDVICDTSFLMLMASGRLRNLDSFDLDNITYVVPGPVVRELEGLANNTTKGDVAIKALRLSATMRCTIPRDNYADDAILEYIIQHGGMVATSDGMLKRRIKAAGGSVISVHNGYMVLETGSSRKDGG